MTREPVDLIVIDSDAEGGQLDDPAAFVRRLNELLLTLAGEGPSRIWVP